MRTVRRAHYVSLCPFGRTGLRVGVRLVSSLAASRRVTAATASAVTASGPSVSAHPLAATASAAAAPTAAAAAKAQPKARVPSRQFMSAAAPAAAAAGDAGSNAGASGDSKAASASGGVLERASAANSVFLLCDVQETFRRVIDGFPQVAGVSRFLLQSAAALQIPVIATEQEPFKPTVAELTDAAAAAQAQVFRKSLFSMLTPPVRQALAARAKAVGGSGVRNVYLFGIEAHVCVLQTALDALRDGYRVFVVADAVSSQRLTDREPALDRMRAAGAVVTTSESALYELCADAKHPAFKQIVGHVKALAQARAAWEAAAGAIGASAAQAVPAALAAAKAKDKDTSKETSKL